MRREGKETSAAVGFRVKSGWAAAVLLVGPTATPQALGRRIVALSDPGFPGTQQPYHAAMGLLEEDQAKISSRTAIVHRVAALSVKATLDDFATAGHRILRAGLVVGSLTDPQSISNPHIRAHSLEGQLFRSVLAAALEAHGLLCSVVLERDAYAKAATTFARSEDDMKRAVTALGRSLEGPWRAEEKLAALAAWMNLD